MENWTEFDITTNLTGNGTLWDSESFISSLFGKIIAILSVLFIPFILGGNILVLMAVFNFEKLQTVTNYFVVSLAVADLLVGAATIPVYVVFYFEAGDIIRNKMACLIRYALVMESCGASLLSLLFISIDRYIAIIHALRYKSIVTPYRARLAIFVLWTYMTVISMLPPMGWNLWEDNSVCDFYKILPRAYIIIGAFLTITVCLFLSTLLYIRIFIEAKRQHNKIKEHAVHRSPAFKRKLDKDLKSAKTMAIVLLMFVIFWLPYLMAAPLRLLLSTSKATVEIIKNFALCLCMSNSIINPVIYALLRKEFRFAFKTLLFQKLVQLRRLSHGNLNLGTVNLSSLLDRSKKSDVNLQKMDDCHQRLSTYQGEIEVISLKTIPSTCDLDKDEEMGSSPVQFM